MVSPTNFFTNPDTLEDNYFMTNQDIPDLNKLAKAEFDSYSSTLTLNGINVLIYDQCHEKAADSVFPNNWISTHKNSAFPEGLLVVYPMKPETRRLEKKPSNNKRYEKAI
jgi:hypothetical protein